MRLPEFTGADEYIEGEVAELLDYLRSAANGKNGNKKAGKGKSTSAKA